MNNICFIIPGLAMNASEFQFGYDNTFVLNNPEIGGSQFLIDDYTLEDVASLHYEKIINILNQEQSLSKKIWIIGMSMGGMINSILASKYFLKLNLDLQFVFLVTSPNFPENPAIQPKRLNEWSLAKRGNVNDFEFILKDFFSKQFLEQKSELTQEYYTYRAQGKNQQSAKAFFKQIKAIQKYDGAKYFSSIPHSSLVIGGGDDRVLGPSHNKDLKKITPKSSIHLEISNLGHMINIERPEYFSIRYLKNIMTEKGT